MNPWLKGLLAILEASSDMSNQRFYQVREHLESFKQCDGFTSSNLNKLFATLLVPPSVVPHLSRIGWLLEVDRPRARRQGQRKGKQ